MQPITIQTIPHVNHRYPTVGDYYEGANGALNIVVSDMQNENYEFLVALHELIESHLCKQRSITEFAITEFDIAFEEQRPAGNTDEPGDSPRAPYQKEHQFATKIEQQVAAELGVDWDAYDKVVINL